MQKEFTVITRYFCQWEYGAKEYFNTEDEATKKATDHYVKKDGMSEENFQYWSKQKFTIGTELVISQDLKTIENK